jgi:hypothetical protein
MNSQKLKKLAKQINYGVEVNINFIPAPSDYFCYEFSDDTITISSFYYRLNKNKIISYLIHELGHKNTLTQDNYLTISDYRAEYEANCWALYRLDELGWSEIFGEYKRYLHELAVISITNEEDEQYQEAAADLLLELELI